MSTATVSFAIRMSPETHVAVKAAALAAGVSMTRWVEATLKAAAKRK